MVNWLFQIKSGVVSNNRSRKMRSMWNVYELRQECLRLDGKGSCCGASVPVRSRLYYLRQSLPRKSDYFSEYLGYSGVV